MALLAARPRRDTREELDSTQQPLIDGAIAHIECGIIGEYEIADHFLAVGNVCALAGHDDADPLLYFRRTYGTHTASAASEDHVHNRIRESVA